ncbi:S-type pyocin domain-containing protein [Pseudomonas sp. NPDC087598]|uniref:S-type pyocin domain-containing protein n=1 Tax=Pseudomonas sp. NPDC087598 TaxID=3364440 RepID=UPI003818F019
MQKPPPWELTEPVHTKGIAPAGMQPAKGTIGSYRYNGTFGTTRNSARYQPILQSHIGILEREFQTSTANIPQSIEVQLAATRQEESTHPLPPAAAIIRELGVRNKLIQRTSAELQHQTNLSHSFYGSDPTSKSADQFLSRALVVDKVLRPDGPGMNLWKQSYRAALQAKLLTQQLALLHQQQVNVHNWLANVQANDQAQAAAAEVARQAAEQARVAAEQQRQREVAEVARMERVSLAELAEAQRLAKERTRIASEQQVKDLRDAARREHEHYLAQKKARIAALAEARRSAADQVAAERARFEVKAETLRRAEAERGLSEIAQRTQKAERWRLRERALRAEEALYRAQAEKARRERILQGILEAQEKNRQQALLDALAEPARQAEQARLRTQWLAQTEARWHNPVFANVGSAAAYGPTFAGTLGNIRNSPPNAQALRVALRAAVPIALTALSTAAVGFAALLVPSELGNGDLFSASVPLSELAPDLDADLYELATAGREVDLPVRLGSRTSGNRVEVVVVSTDGVTVPSKVPVVLARFDAQKNIYVSSATSTESKGPVVTWTPLVNPLNPSTDLPVADTDLPIYEGADVTLDSGRIDPFPQLDQYGFGGWVTVFPIDSGIPPIFTMFRDRRQDPGIASGMGQTVSGNWLEAAATQQGAPIPTQIADKLRGREFSSFRAFRRAFWKAVSADPQLNSELFHLSKIETKKGLAVRADIEDQVGKKIKYDLHHVNPVGNGGEVYDIDNLRLLTPKQHIETHASKKKGL